MVVVVVGGAVVATDAVAVDDVDVDFELVVRELDELVLAVFGVLCPPAAIPIIRRTTSPATTNGQRRRRLVTALPFPGWAFRGLDGAAPGGGGDGGGRGCPPGGGGVGGAGGT